MKISYKSVNYGNYQSYANKVLGHALRAVQLGVVLNIDINNSPQMVPAIGQDLVHSQFFINNGPKEYGGAVKGHALMGFVEYHVHNRQKKIAANQQTLNAATTEYLCAHGYNESQITTKLINSVHPTYVAMWFAFKERALVAPTSGSFGLAACQTVDKLRQAEAFIDNGPNARTHKIFSESDCNARAWIPDISLGIMTSEKTDFIHNTAEALGLDVKVWTERNTRDHFALLDALSNGDYFCPTNPKNPKEVADILSQTLENSFDGVTIFSDSDDLAKLKLLKQRIAAKDEKVLAALESISITTTYEGNEVTLRVTDSLSAGRYGLMIPRLRHIDALLEIPGFIREDVTYNQPAIGATFAAAVDVDGIIRAAFDGKLNLNKQNRALLKKLFPNIISIIEQAEEIRRTGGKKGYTYWEEALMLARESSLSVDSIWNELFAPHKFNKDDLVPGSDELKFPIDLQLRIAADVCNTTLADSLGIGGERPPHKKNPENGLGSITPGLESLDVIRSNIAMGNKSISMQCTPATKPWIMVARVLIYLSEIDKRGTNARFPEAAGAASLACALKTRYENTAIQDDFVPLQVEDIVCSIRRRGISKHIFERALELCMPAKDILDRIYPGEDFTDPWSYIEAEAKTHGGSDPEFVNKLKQAFNLRSKELVKTVSPSSMEPFRSISIYNTGSNGTKHIHNELLRLLIKEGQEQLKYRNIIVAEGIGQTRNHIAIYQTVSANHVAVIGAGLAGLTTANHLAAQGFNVTVYDTRPEVSQATSAGPIGMITLQVPKGLDRSLFDVTIEQGGYKSDLVDPATVPNAKWIKQIPDAFRQNQIQKSKAMIATQSVKVRAAMLENEKNCGSRALKEAGYNYNSEGGATKYFLSEAEAERYIEELHALGITSKLDQIEPDPRFDKASFLVKIPGGQMNAAIYCKVLADELVATRKVVIIPNANVSELVVNSSRIQAVRVNGIEHEFDSVIVATGAETALLQPHIPNRAASKVAPFTGVTLTIPLGQEQVSTLPQSFQFPCKVENGKSVGLNGAVIKTGENYSLRIGGFFIAGRLKPGAKSDYTERKLHECAARLIPGYNNDGQIWYGERPISPQYFPQFGSTGIEGLSTAMDINSSGVILSDGAASLLAIKMRKQASNKLPSSLRQNHGIIANLEMLSAASCR